MKAKRMEKIKFIDSKFPNKINDNGTKITKNYITIFEMNIPF